MAIQWVRSDQREARRIDRRIDRGDADDPLAAYNAYLAGLHARDRRAAGHRDAVHGDDAPRQQPPTV